MRASRWVWVGNASLYSHALVPALFAASKDAVGRVCASTELRFGLDLAACFALFDPTRGRLNSNPLAAAKVATFSAALLTPSSYAESISRISLKFGDRFTNQTSRTSLNHVTEFTTREAIYGLL